MAAVIVITGAKEEVRKKTNTGNFPGDSCSYPV